MMKEIRGAKTLVGILAARIRDEWPGKNQALFGEYAGNSGPLGYMAGVVYEGCEGGIGQDESR